MSQPDRPEYGPRDSAPSSLASASRVTQLPLACQACGRQDETLRLVVYPYVISLFIVTYRRAFAGVWCSAHRNEKLWLASLITALLGWIGIPFGFIWTPKALFQLAQGGIQPPDDNANLLKRLGEHFRSKGNAAAAARCLEASLDFRDDPSVRQQLHDARLALPRPESGMNWLLAIPSGILGAMFIGAFVGFLDHLLSYMLGNLITGKVSIYLIIIEWGISIAIAFIGGLALFQFIGSLLKRVRSTNSVVAIVFATVLAAIAAYSVFQGNAIADFAQGIFWSDLASSSKLLVYAIEVLLLGGYGWIMMLFEDASLGANLYLILYAVMAVYYLGFAIATARHTAQWQQRIKPV